MVGATCDDQLVPRTFGGCAVSVTVAAADPTESDLGHADLPSVRLGDRRIPVVLPKRTDPRLHLSIVTISLFVLGIGWLEFRLSIPQIMAAVITAAIIDVAVNLRRNSILVWPASGLQTASSIALLLRVTGTESGDLWTWRGWYYFAGVAAFALLTKHVVRFRGGHLFNPSNVALVVGFVVLGSGRIEPLDLWWGPLDAPMVLAYVVILLGGLLISRRLGLLEMGIAFWVTLAFGMAVLAALDHSITAQWSLSPIAGAHFWWIVMTSPEILIYLFFMLTDPRTVPVGRTARIVFGVLVGVVASLLAAPWGTEFGTKVGLLAGLAVVSSTRPLLERRLPEPGEPLDDPATFARQMLSGRRAGARMALGIAVVAAVGASVAIASLPARQPAGQAGPGLDVVAAIDASTLPVVAVDANIHKLDQQLATPEGARELAAALAWNLAVEHEALRTRDPSLLVGVDHGYRLDQLDRSIAELGPADPATAPSYRFDALRLMIAYPGGAQAGANAGLVATGTVEHVSYAPSGEELSRSAEPFAVTFTLRRTTSGTWQITDTLPVPK